MGAKQGFACASVGRRKPKARGARGLAPREDPQQGSRSSFFSFPDSRPSLQLELAAPQHARARNRRFVLGGVGVWGWRLRGAANFRAIEARRCTRSTRAQGARRRQICQARLILSRDRFVSYFYSIARMLVARGFGSTLGPGGDSRSSPRGVEQQIKTQNVHL